MLISGSAYITAWVAYLVCFVIAFFAFTRLIRWLRPVFLRQALKGFVIVLFLTPVAVDGDRQWFAPAWLEGGYEAILGDMAAASDALFNLSVAAIAMALLVVADAFWRRRKTSQAAGETPANG